MSDPGSRQAATTTQRCPVCQRMNRVPRNRTARCGACKTVLPPPGVGASAERAGELGRLVIDRWEALLRLVPRDLALGRAVGRSSSAGPTSDPIAWLSTAAHMPRADLDQVRLLRIHLASNKAAPPHVLRQALDTLDRAHAALERTRLPE